MAFHFTSETPDDQLYTDFGNLAKFPDDAFSQLVTIVISFLVEPYQSSRLLTRLGEFAAEQGINPGGLKNVVRSFLAFLKVALRKNLSPPHLEEDLQQLGLSTEKSALVAAQWKLNLIALSRTALGQTLTVNRLVDMDWRFGVTAASSDVKKVGNSFLQVKFSLDKGGKTEDVYMELSLHQFYQFLHEMEKAKASLEYMS
ncbi:COMM domain-containing protein 7-like [Oscarella lobularis]|uniref:COMM domain-containing protein 7-like n=1 Tax=Oscarella lobularis TaxID=121494 RepID=UPI003313E66E